MNGEPIAAIATAPGAGAIAMLRMSGDGCHDLTKQLLPKTFKSQPRFMHYATLYDPVSKEAVDDVTLVFYQGPHSFTGQDCVEIFCHGSPYILQRLLAILRTLGCRDAQPGEFTQRAFLSGKMDLTAAEGINELIQAQSHQQWLAARQLVTGKLKDQIESLRKELIGAMAYLEASIDFPDEGDVNVGRQDVKLRVATVMAGVNKLLATYSDGCVAARGLQVALVGLPNAGKSTLMNTLLGHERAIVTAEPGTTRDYLEEPCLVDGRLLRLFDTAGIREGKSIVEKIGIETALRLAKDADIVLILMAADTPENERQQFEQTLGQLHQPHLRVLTKSDLGVPAWGAAWLPISCTSASGLEKLKQALVAAVDRHTGHLQEDVFITSARHAEALTAARNYLDVFMKAVDCATFDECLAFELQSATRELAQIIGVVDHDEILEKIFSSFCVGK